jgi:hypothetical protein
LLPLTRLCRFDGSERDTSPRGQRPYHRRYDCVKRSVTSGDSSDNADDNFTFVSSPTFSREHEEILVHPMFWMHHSETQMPRYMKTLENRDLVGNDHRHVAGSVSHPSLRPVRSGLRVPQNDHGTHHRSWPNPIPVQPAKMLVCWHHWNV